MERRVNDKAVRRQGAVERSRRERWNVDGVARVAHPTYGTAVVPHHSNLAALMNAAQVWNCKWTDILDAQVWRAEPEEKPVSMPHMI